jgi:hypothetical protein
MELDLRRFRIVGRKIDQSARNSRKVDRLEPVAPQLFWIAGISLLLLAEALILGGLASMNTDLRGAGQVAARGVRGPVKAR